MRSDFAPFFIIGAPRSGTKYLRDLICSSERCSSIPYDINFFWRHHREKYFHDDITYLDIDEDQVGWIRSNLPKIFNKTSTKSFLFEKTVSNTLRIPLLDYCFPNSKFIHLVRDGREVTESLIRMWQEPTDYLYLLKKLKYFPAKNYMYAFWFLKEKIRSLTSNRFSTWGPRYNSICDDMLNDPLHLICAKQWYHCVTKASEDLAVISKDRVFTIHYNELISSYSKVEHLCSFIGVGKSELKKYWSRSIKNNNRNKWLNNLDEEVLHDIQQVFSKIPSSQYDFIFNS